MIDKVARNTKRSKILIDDERNDYLIVDLIEFVTTFIVDYYCWFLVNDFVFVNRSAVDRMQGKLIFSFESYPPVAKILIAMEDTQLTKLCFLMPISWNISDFLVLHLLMTMNWYAKNAIEFLREDAKVIRSEKRLHMLIDDETYALSTWCLTSKIIQVGVFVSLWVILYSIVKYYRSIDSYSIELL
jgi:hypothetical protein